MPVKIRSGLISAVADWEGFEKVIGRSRQGGEKRNIDRTAKDKGDQGIDCTSKRVAHKDAGMFTSLQIRDPRESYLWVLYSEYIGATWVIHSLELVHIDFHFHFIFY